jgi:hypothetical protein
MFGSGRLPKPQENLQTQMGIAPAIHQHSFGAEAEGDSQLENRRASPNLNQQMGRTQ